MIRLQNIRFQYETTGQYGLFDVSLTVKRGELAVITGEQGCGKTTMLKLLQGWLPIYEKGKMSGRVEVFGSLVSLEIRQHKIPYDAAIDADVIIFDEPLHSLANTGSSELLSVLDRWKKEGKTIVIAEQRADAYIKLADQILHMKNGRMEYVS